MEFRDSDHKPVYADFVLRPAKTDVWEQYVEEEQKYDVEEI